MHYSPTEGKEVMTQSTDATLWHGTTVLCVRKDNQLVMGADGMVSMQHTIVKHHAKKIRKLCGGRVLVGFAGSTADAFTLLERLEKKLDQHPDQTTRACVELAKDWRTDRYLRRLEAMMIVADASVSLLVSGTGDVLEPDDHVLAIGSGGNFALSSARALMAHSTLSASEIVKQSLLIAADICVHTNKNIILEQLGDVS